MSSEEEKEYIKRLDDYVSINVIKLNDIQFGYKIRKETNKDNELVFEFQSTNDTSVLKVAKGIETCVINDHYGFVNSLNGMDSREDLSKLSDDDVRKLNMKLDIIHKKFYGNFSLIYHGLLENESTGYKYIIMFTNIAKSELHIFKIRGINIDYEKLDNSDFGESAIFFNQIIRVQ